MHHEVAAFLRSAKEPRWLASTVYEIGSLDVNGRASDHVPGGWKSWTGIDLVDGPGVDIPGDATGILPILDPCDIVVCCEVLEHYEQWPVLVAAMCDVLKPDGWLVLTCAGIGRKPHAADGTDGGPHPGEYYANVSLAELEAATVGMTAVRGEESWPGDTRYLGRKVVS